jgi:hypothetical protein
VRGFFFPTNGFIEWATFFFASRCVILIFSFTGCAFVIRLTSHAFFCSFRLFSHVRWRCSTCFIGLTEPDFSCSQVSIPTYFIFILLVPAQSASYPTPKPSSPKPFLHTPSLLPPSPTPSQSFSFAAAPSPHTSLSTSSISSSFNTSSNPACWSRDFSFVTLIIGSFSLVSFLIAGLQRRSVLRQHRCILALDERWPF